MGEQLSVQRIPLLVPSAPRAEEILPHLRRLDESRWYSNFGHLNRQLEAELSAFFYNAACTTVSSGTLALELALRATMHECKGRTVLVPSFTYPATILAVVNAGGVPVFCDVDEKSWCMNADAPLHATAIRLPVCSFGRSVDWIHDAWNNDALVIDAAAAFSNQAIDPRFLSCYSLHATKYPNCGEGGFVAGKEELVESVRRMSAFGMNVERACELPFGTNAKLSEYHAAVALASLKRLRDQEQAFTDLEERYLDALEDACPNVEVQGMDGGLRTAMPVLLPEGVDVNEARIELNYRGIETRRWYFPLCHTMPAFREFPRYPMPVSENLSRRLLGLPYHLYLTPYDIARIVQALAAAIEKQGLKP